MVLLLTLLTGLYKEMQLLADVGKTDFEFGAVEFIQEKGINLSFFCCFMHSKTSPPPRNNHTQYFSPAGLGFSQHLGFHLGFTFVLEPDQTGSNL